MGINNTKLFYFDHNHRIYEMNGVKKSAPFQEGYYIPLTIVSETDKEYICQYGKIKKKTMQYHWGRQKFKVYTEQQKDDDVYVQENRHIIAEKVRKLPADKLRLVEELLD